MEEQEWIPAGKICPHYHVDLSLIQAIGDGDVGRAEQLMRAHTERTTEFYRKEFVPANQAPSG